MAKIKLSKSEKKKSKESKKNGVSEVAPSELDGYKGEDKVI